MRRGLVALVAPTLLLAGCAERAPVAAPTATVYETVRPEASPPPASQSPISTTVGRDFDTDFAMVEALPSLMDLGPDAPRPNLALRPRAWREVAIVQMSLNIVAEDLGLEVDGHFGPDTDAALREFQTAAGIEPDGYAGPETFKWLIYAISLKGGAIPAPIPTAPSTTPTLPPYYGGGSVTMCSDGSWSSSTGQGTCSWHGGING